MTAIARVQRLAALGAVCLVAFGHAQRRIDANERQRVTSDKQDTAALAAELLAAPADARAKLLADRGVVPDKALIDALLSAVGKRLTAADYTRAIDGYLYTIDLARRIDERIGLGDALLGLGQAYGRRGDYDRAKAVLDECIRIATALGDDRLLGAGLNNLGIVHRLQGDYEEARGMYRRMLSLAEKNHNDDQIARALNNLGIIETYQGMYDAAISDIQRSLDIARRLNNAGLIANGTVNLGNIYYYQNNCALAVELYERVLADAAKSGSVTGQLSALTNIAACERTTRHLDSALTRLRKALAIAQEHDLAPDVGRVRYGLAIVYMRQRRWREARDELNASLEIRESIGDRLGLAETLVQQGQVLLALGEGAAGLEAVRRAASIADEIDLADAGSGAYTVEGRILRTLDRGAEAEVALRRAIAIVEATRARIAGTDVDRARFLSDALEPYLDLADLLASEHRDFEALTIAEQAHARALTDAVSGGGADDVLTPEERDRQRALETRLGALNRQIAALPPGPAGAARMKELASSRRAARVDLDRLTATLYAAHPDLRMRFGAPPPLTSAALARRLDASTAIVEFVAGAERTLMLIATAGRDGPIVRAHTVPLAGAELDARIAAFNEAIASRDLRIASEARALGSLLLDPVLATRKTRLIIVPDGSLWSLPFQALRTADDSYLVERRLVSYAPSIVALQLLGDRRAAPGARAGFVGVADPDPAHPLPDARRQVETLAGDPALHGIALTGAAATEAAVRKAVAFARVVHIASHGVFEDASPLYSHIVLAPGEGSDTSNDGRLDAWELMRLRLRASLVVLAACETGRGDVRRGEGVIGLSWAALASGAPATVVSLWRVDEAATGEWMTAFYKSWPTAGASRAAADAARALLASERYRHPFYWAPFVVIGDPSRPPAPPSRPPRVSAAPRSTDPARRP